MSGQRHHLWGRMIKPAGRSGYWVCPWLRVVCSFRPCLLGGARVFPSYARETGGGNLTAGAITRIFLTCREG
ncbi:MAG: hypothetical protein LZF60_80079 [Nitrospira sp.]|nr:MAG: hypothetical protein LZF60_80079 [Nitrospira sp.]